MSDLRILSILIILSTFVFGCSFETEERDIVVAEVGTKKLRLSDISAVIPGDISGEDSTIMADDYIRKWVRQELVLRKAEENLSLELKNVEKELNEYRNSLLIFKYKNELMLQRMDTTVTDAQILERYTENPENFILEYNIVKGAFIKVPQESADPERLKMTAADLTPEGIQALRDYCIQYATGYDIINNRWVRLDQLIKNIPEKPENLEQLLQKEQFIECNDSTSYYMIVIHDYKLKNEQAPIEYVRNSIKSLILNRRKIEFLKEIENKIYLEGVNKNSFKIYNINKDGAS